MNPGQDQASKAFLAAGLAFTMTASGRKLPVESWRLRSLNGRIWEKRSLDEPNNSADTICHLLRRVWVENEEIVYFAAVRLILFIPGAELDTVDSIVNHRWYCFYAVDPFAVEIK